MKKSIRARLSQPGDVPIPKLKPTDELDWHVVYEELRTYFNSKEDAKDAKNALERLVAAGCDERLILQNLYLFCGGNPDAMRNLREALNFKGCGERLLSIASLLQEASRSIPEADQLLAGLDMTHTLTPDTSRLEAYSELLEKAGSMYQNRASKRVSGRDQHLGFLCRLVEYVTGREHYREVADLVNAAYQLYDPGSTKTETEESIRKRASRHSPEMADVELEMMSESHIIKKFSGK